MKNIVLAITGASGSIYALRLLDVLLAQECKVHLTISPSGAHVLWQELQVQVDLNRFSLTQLLEPVSEDPNLFEQSFDSRMLSLEDPPDLTERLQYHHYQNFGAGIASGSFLTAGMVICPCSMGTVASVAHGLSSNLIQRAADVHMKERRKLIVVPRETPLGSIQLENLKRLSEAGAVVLPAMPGFYHGAQTISDLVDFVVARICDQLGIRVDLMKRWGSE